MDKTVFISYAWEKDDTKDKKIKDFAQWLTIYLRKWGFNTLLDIYENRPGTNLDEYMKKGINSSRFVLCICTETYIEKMKDPSTGVFNEMTLLNKLALSPFIIPIIEKGKFMNLPKFFNGKFVSQLRFDRPYAVENRKSIFELITTIRDECLSSSEVQEEKRIESYYNNVEKFKFWADTIDLMSFNSQTEGIVTFEYLRNGGDFKIGIPPMEFITHWATAGRGSIYSCNKVQKMMRIHNFNEYETIKKPSDLKDERMVPIKWAVNLKIGDGILWINSNNYVAIGLITEVNIDPEDEYKNTVTLDYKVLNPIDITDDFIEFDRVDSFIEKKI